MKGNFKLRLVIAIFWLILIYLFLPFTPDFINFLYRRFGFSFVKQLLVVLSLFGALLVYLPFIRKFRLNRFLPYVIVTIILAIGCAINVAVITGFKFGFKTLYGLINININIARIPARALHIPEYAILSLFLYNAFIVKYQSKKSYFLSIIIGISAGIVDERIIQYLLPMRYYDLGDILLNSAGIIIGIILILAYREKGDRHLFQQKITC